MGLEDILDFSKEAWHNTKYLFKRQSLLLTTLSILSGFYVLGCSSKSDEGGYGGPTGPSNPGSSSGSTNSSGNVELVVNSNTFNVNIEDEDGEPLSEISVEVQYNGGGRYEFLAEDFSGNYFCETAYYPAGPTTEGINGLDINMELSKKNPFSGTFKIENKQVPFNSPHPNLDSLGTVVLTELWDFYQENDIIVKNKSYLEYVAQNSNIPWFTIALEAENFRETFIENASNVSEIINYICSLFGQEFDPDAYYLDVYSNKIGVLTHFENSDGYCTIKGDVSDGYSGEMLSGVSISVYEGISSASTFTNSSGNYLLKFLLEGNYTLFYSLEGYGDEFRVRTLNAPNPPFYSSTYVDATLYYSPSVLDTLVIQPGSTDGKDSYSSVWYDGGTPVYGDAVHGSETGFYAGETTTGAPIDYESYIQFNLSSMPSDFYIEKAELYLKGGMYALNNIELELSRIMDAWSESTVCYNNKPSSVNYDTYWFNTSTNPSSYQYIFDITSLVTMWHNGNVANNGIAIDVPSNTSGFENYTLFKSSDVSVSSDRPKLLIMGY